ncbi:MAG: hypothetical protein JST87_17715 [Bacteroidetes bacterium]|nr:hypothetical protein [Bacteroidota bacterium]
MEVHHHPQLIHKPKPWKEYILEYVMIFLAVTTGFFAESLREHISDKEKEKNYIVSLIADLKADIKNADATISESKTLALLLDSMFTVLNDPSQIKKQGDLIYYAGRLGPRIGIYVNNQRTFDQLNTGGFRLIQDIETSNRIIDYYALFPHLRLLENGGLKEFEHYQSIASNILDPVAFHKQETATGTIVRGNDNPALLTYDPKLLKQLELYIVYMNGSRRSIIPDLENIKKSSNELIQFLQNKYHLESGE